MSIKHCFHCGKPYTYFPQHQPVCPGETVRTSPYRENPQRRLRRLRRLFEKCGGPPTFDPPNFPDIPYDYRLERAEELLGMELEWACRTAMLSIGGEW